MRVKEASWGSILLPRNTHCQSLLTGWYKGYWQACSVVATDEGQTMKRLQRVEGVGAL